MKNLIVLILFLLIVMPVRADDVWIIPIDGAIGPASAHFVVTEIESAQREGASLVILQMDTPGGLDAAMRDMIQAITNASVPIATWVGPAGARAASAGTYILLASHIAAMAEATNLGAATPVSLIGGTPKSPASDDDQTTEDDNNDTATDDPKAVPAKTAMEKKVINDARAYITGLARLHGRNAEWAQTAVSEAASIDSHDAADLNVIDFVANSLDEVVEKSQGRVVTLDNHKVTLSFSEIRWVERQPDWRAELLAVLTNPNIAYLLMMIGIYGIILEFYNPGIGLPGILGGICLLLAMYALQMLPLNYAGLALLLLGIVLMIAEAFSPSFGLFGLGGIVAFVFGSIFLFDSDIPGFQVALPLIAGISLFSVLVIILMLTLLLKVRRQGVTTGAEVMIGKTTVVVDELADGRGEVLLGGERWSAVSSLPLKKGQQVIVTELKGLTLVVNILDRTRID
ncbi:NfeD family protein [Thaumasiovibrio sp. DFM-14]|uniref:NfeD family protein n=1 Tax=Thaumasiovibrio sp. DFM-14 TaxID=3384792 RepID=UPI0039A3F46A